MSKKIKKSHILIICAGSSALNYKKEIENFIKKNEVITFGCNNISHIFIPDYHVWGDRRRYLMFGENTSRKSKVIFSRAIPNNIRKKHKKIIKKFKVIDFKDLKMKTLPNTIFNTIGCLVMLYVHSKGASDISIVGMDGYTYYSQNELNNGLQLQHCYNDGIDKLPSNYDIYKNTGYTDVITDYEYAESDENKKKDKDTFYNHCKNKDEFIYNALKSLKEYGVNFEILTPTVYKEFYNPKVFER